MNSSGTHILVMDLKLKPKSENRDALIFFVKNGYYHLKGRIEDPDKELQKHLLSLDFKDLASYVKNGAYNNKVKEKRQKEAQKKEKVYNKVN